MRQTNLIKLIALLFVVAVFVGATFAYGYSQRQKNSQQKSQPAQQPTQAESDKSASLPEPKPAVPTQPSSPTPNASSPSPRPVAPSKAGSASMPNTGSASILNLVPMAIIAALWAFYRHSRPKRLYR